LSAVTPDNFLVDAEAPEIPWAKPSGAPVAVGTKFVKIGPGLDGLEVALAVTVPEGKAPKADDVRRLWNLRWNRRAAPVVLIVAHRIGDTWKASVCGTKDDPAVIPALDLDQVERICAAALTAPDSANAERTLHRLLVGQKDELVAGLTKGIRGEGPLQQQAAGADEGHQPTPEHGVRRLRRHRPGAGSSRRDARPSPGPRTPPRPRRHSAQQIRGRGASSSADALTEEAPVPRAPSKSFLSLSR
jgi:hypothetical protein